MDPDQKVSNDLLLLPIHAVLSGGSKSDKGYFGVVFLVDERGENPNTTKSGSSLVHQQNAI